MCKVVERRSYVSQNLQLLELAVAKEPFNIQHRVAYIDELMVGDSGHVEMANKMLEEMKTGKKHTCAWTSGIESRCNSHPRELQLVSRSGFISEIRGDCCSLADQGKGMRLYIRTVLENAWDLFRSYPITRVIPYAGMLQYNVGYMYIKRKLTPKYVYCYPQSQLIPEEVWNRLTGQIEAMGRYTGPAKVYTQRKMAIDDMSNAIVDECRSIAKLPPLQRQ